MLANFGLFAPTSTTYLATKPKPEQTWEGLKSMILSRSKDSVERKSQST